MQYSPLRLCCQATSITIIKRFSFWEFLQLCFQQKETTPQPISKDTSIVNLHILAARREGDVNSKPLPLIFFLQQQGIGVHLNPKVEQGCSLMFEWQWHSTIREHPCAWLICQSKPKASGATTRYGKYLTSREHACSTLEATRLNIGEFDPFP